jgi:hypothetical protein
MPQLKVFSSFRGSLMPVDSIRVAGNVFEVCLIVSAPLSAGRELVPHHEEVAGAVRVRRQVPQPGLLRRPGRCGKNNPLLHTTVCLEQANSGQLPVCQVAGRRRLLTNCAAVSVRASIVSQYAGAKHLGQMWAAAGTATGAVLRCRHTAGAQAGRPCELPHIRRGSGCTTQGTAAQPSRTPGDSFDQGVPRTPKQELHSIGLQVCTTFPDRTILGMSVGIAVDLLAVPGCIAEVSRNLVVGPHCRGLAACGA